jgi:hypothetical protein
LCFKHGLKDPWTGLIHTSPGQYAPQDHDEPAIWREERQQVRECLILLSEACAGFKREAPVEGREAEPRSWFRRVWEFFY